jgi:hypothetical protein
MGKDRSSSSMDFGIEVRKCPFGSAQAQAVNNNMWRCRIEMQGINALPAFRFGERIVAGRS